MTKQKLPAIELIAALGLPPTSTVNYCVPKKMLAENSVSTAADRKLIQDYIDEVLWVAALKPANSGVPAYKDERRAYLELAVLCVALREYECTRLDQKSTTVRRIAELVHRAIPYPVLLVLDDNQNLSMSLAHIRWAQKEADTTVIDGEPLFVMLKPLSAARDRDRHIEGRDARDEFLASLPLSKQPRNDMFALYQGWMDTIFAWQAASVTGRFFISESPEHAAKRQAALRRCAELDARIARLRSIACKEKQIARQVAANLEIKALLAERQQIVTHF